MTGKVCLVTGATSGIGREVARGLVRMGATVVVGARDRARGDALRAELGVEVHAVDVSSQASLRAFAAGVLERHEKIHVLVNNAGAWMNRRELTVDGIERTWATNVLGYSLLSTLLLPRLRESAPARIINVASVYAGDVDLDDVQFEQRAFGLGVAAYRQSKAADRMLTWALAAQLQGTGVTANALHPGGVATAIYRDTPGLGGAAWRAWVRLTKDTPAQGADTPLWLASSPDVEGVSGKFWSKRRETKCEFRDPALTERLWTLCAQMTGAP